MAYEEKVFEIQNLGKDNKIKWKKCNMKNFLTNNDVLKGDLILNKSYYDTINSIKIIKKITKHGIEGWLYSQDSNYFYRMPSLLINKSSKLILINNLREFDMPYNANYAGVSKEYAYCLQKELESIITNDNQEYANYKLIIATDFIEKEPLIWGIQISESILNYIENDSSENSINNSYFKNYYEKNLKNNKAKIQATIDLLKNNPKQELVSYGFLVEDYMFDIFWIFDYLNNLRKEEVINEEIKKITRSSPNYDWYKYGYIDAKVNNELRLKLLKKPSKMINIDRSLLNSIKDTEIFIVESKKLKPITIQKCNDKFNSFYQTIENSNYRTYSGKYEKIIGIVFMKKFPSILDIIKITNINGKILYTI